MDKSNNNTGKFEFEFNDDVSNVESGEEAVEFDENMEGFGVGEEELIDKSEVIILTNNYCVRGKISLVPGARLTDYIVGAKSFIAVIDASVSDKLGNFILSTSFLNVSREHVEIILPADIATLSESRQTC